MKHLKPYERTALIWSLVIAIGFIALVTFCDERDERGLEQWRKQQETHAHHQR